LQSLRRKCVSLPFCLWMNVTTNSEPHEYGIAARVGCPRSITFVLARYSEVVFTPQYICPAEA
jgi:hypothetical protein